MKPLVIAGKTFGSRLFVGTGKFSSSEMMGRAIEASGSELVTVALKRVEMENPQDDILSHLKTPQISLLPNTSGVPEKPWEPTGSNWRSTPIPVT